MRAVQRLVYQVSLSGIEQMDLGQCQELLEEAFNEETGRDILMLLDAALSRTDIGETPAEELATLLELVPQAGPEEEQLRIEKEIRELASALWPVDWQTAMYGELADVLLPEGDLESYRRSMSERLDRSAASYREAIDDGEGSNEVIVRHRLFLEALEDLRESLEYLDNNPQAALKWAEQGNRMLIAVQRYTDRYNAGWIKTRGGKAPPYPVRGGTDADGAPLYVAAAFIYGEMLPGATRMPFHQAFVTHHGEALVVSDFEMLSDLSVGWVRPDEENWMAGVYLGHGDSLWCVARGKCDGNWMPGRIRREAQSCTIPHGQGEIECPEFEILVRLSQA